MIKRLWALLVLAVDHPEGRADRCAEELADYRCQRSAYPHRVHYHIDGLLYLRWKLGSANYARRN